MAQRRLDTSALGPIRINPLEDQARFARAESILDRHCPDDGQTGTQRERRRWTIDAMLHFANEERARGGL